MADILEDISNSDLVKLRDIFKVNWPHNIHIYMFLNSCFNSKNKNSSDDIQVTSPKGNWRDGTFVAITTVSK